MHNRENSSIISLVIQLILAEVFAHTLHLIYIANVTRSLGSLV